MPILPNYGMIACCKTEYITKHSIQFGRGIEETHIQTQSHQVYRQWIVLDYRWRITKLLFYVITHFLNIGNRL